MPPKPMLKEDEEGEKVLVMEETNMEGMAWAKKKLPFSPHQFVFISMGKEGKRGFFAP